MGTKPSKEDSDQTQEVIGYCEQLNQNVTHLQEKLDSLNQDYVCRGEIDPRINLLEKNSVRINEKLSHLLTVAKDQQKIIVDLGGKYSYLYGEYEKQAQTLFDMEFKFLEEIKEYQNELRDTKEKLVTIEKEIATNSELCKVIGIRKTDNMIKKEKISPRISLAIENIPERVSMSKNKLRGKLQEIRNQRKAGKEIMATGDGDFENYYTHQDLNTFEKVNGKNTSNKENLVELDINTMK